MRYSDCKTVAMLDAERERRKRRKGKRQTPHCYKALEEEAYLNAYLRLMGIEPDRPNPDDAMSHLDPSFDFDLDENELTRQRHGFLSGCEDGVSADYGDCADDGQYGFDRQVNITSHELGVSVELAEQALPCQRVIERLVVGRKNRKLDVRQERVIGESWFPDWRLPVAAIAADDAPLEPVPAVNRNGDRLTPPPAIVAEQAAAAVVRLISSDLGVYDSLVRQDAARRLWSPVPRAPLTITAPGKLVLNA